MKLALGYNTDFQIREGSYRSTNDLRFSVAYLSDFHFTRFSSSMLEPVANRLEQLKPDIILLGGDYVDSRKGLFCLQQFLEKIAHHHHIYAIAGNHDYYFGIEKIKSVFQQQQIQWIEQSSVTFKIKNRSIKIDGNLPKSKSDDVDFSILCLHKPIDIRPYQHQYHLAFAGHLHGSQFVFWQRGQRLYPGRLFFRWNLLQTQLGPCHYYISKGLGDTLPIRYNCPKDLIFIQISPDAQNPVV